MDIEQSIGGFADMWPWWVWGGAGVFAVLTHGWRKKHLNILGLPDWWMWTMNVLPLGLGAYEYMRQESGESSQGPPNLPF